MASFCLERDAVPKKSCRNIGRCRYMGIRTGGEMRRGGTPVLGGGANKGKEKRMPPSPTDEPAGYRINRDEGKDKGEREAGPEKQGSEGSLPGTREGRKQ